MFHFEINQPVGKKIPTKLWRQWFAGIEKALKIKKDLTVSVGIVSAKAIKKLNRIYRHKNEVTDVLSFSNSTGEAKYFGGKDLGEIVICYSQAAAQAKVVGHSVNAEIELLLVHGFLHLLGHDHEKLKEAKAMRELENKIIKNC